jgi:hypothetical protein
MRRPMNARFTPEETELIENTMDLWDESDRLSRKLQNTLDSLPDHLRAAVCNARLRRMQKSRAVRWANDQRAKNLVPTRLFPHRSENSTANARWVNGA